MTALATPSLESLDRGGRERRRERAERHTHVERDVPAQGGRRRRRVDREARRVVDARAGVARRRLSRCCGTNSAKSIAPHFDYFHDEFNQRREKGGQRVATVLMYLTDVEEGGETIFPDAEAGANPGGGDGASSCAAGKLAVKPRKGDALFFRSLHHNGTFDKMSMHAGCPVVKGVKFSATKWMHVAPIQDFGDAVRFQPGVCKDVNAACKGWASSGECTKNPSFMVGRGRANGNCMRSCGACPPGARDD